MLLAIDVGNTNIVLGVFEKSGNLLFSSRLVTDSAKTEDQYAIDFRDILRLYKAEELEITGSILSSVSPPMTTILSRAVERLFGCPPLIVGPGIKTGRPIAIDNPAQLGSDMVVTATAASAKYQKPAIVIDMGTATTISYVNKDGVYCGCAILAGVRTALTALTSRTAQLTSIAIEAPSSVIGKNTVDAMQAGVVYGTASMVDGMIERIESEYGPVATVVATGGMAREVVPFCRKQITFDPDLLMNGLYLLYKKNRPNF
ncbi:MAG: type III pantothenate kinase [Clostridia bacterium]|nr:type III pantothenate kinase [Clostridia bacterium]